MLGSLLLLLFLLVEGVPLVLLLLSGSLLRTVFLLDLLLRLINSTAGLSKLIISMLELISNFLVLDC